MQQTGIPDINLGRAHLALTQVGVPRLQLAHHEDVRKKIEITSCGGLVHPKRTSRLSRVPDLAMIMREHRPEAPQGFGWRTHAPLREVPFEQRLDKRFTPSHTV